MAAKKVDIIADSRPASLPRPTGSVLDRIALFNKMANEAKNLTKPILPTKQYRPAAFTKKFNNNSNTMTDEEMLAQTTVAPKKFSGPPKVNDMIPVVFPTELKIFSAYSGKTQKQLMDEFERIYVQNPAMWDSIIDCTRFQLRYGEFGDEPVSLTEDVSVPENSNMIYTFSKEIMEEINKVRLNPSAYAAVVQSRFERFVDDHVYRLHSGEYMKTVEGQEAVLEAVEFLRNCAPLPPFEVSKFLSESTMDHVDDMLANNLMGHDSSSGLGLKDRIEKYCQWRGQVGENIRFGSNDATEIIINLLIDDGVEARGQRKNILSKDFKYIGCAIASHDVYRFICVMNFAGDLIDNSLILKQNCVKVLKSVEDLEDNDVKRIIASIPYNGDMDADIRKEFAAMVPPQTLQVTLDFLYEEKRAKVSYKRGPKTTMRTLTWTA